MLSPTFQGPRSSRDSVPWDAASRRCASPVPQNMWNVDPCNYYTNIINVVIITACNCSRYTIHPASCCMIPTKPAARHPQSPPAAQQTGTPMKPACSTAMTRHEAPDPIQVLSLPERQLPVGCCRLVQLPHHALCHGLVVVVCQGEACCLAMHLLNAPVHQFLDDLRQPGVA